MEKLSVSLVGLLFLFFAVRDLITERREHNEFKRNLRQFKASLATRARPRNLAPLTFLLFSMVSNQAFALPCGGPQKATPPFRWRPTANPEGVSVTGYWLYRTTKKLATPSQMNGNTYEGDYTGVVPISMGSPSAALDGTVTATDGEFDSTKTWYVVMTAKGPSGESFFSNEKIIPATTTGACPPPLPPTLVDVIKILETSLITHQEALRLLQEYAKSNP